MPTTIEEIKSKKNALESEIQKFQDAIECKLAKGEFDVDNMCARVNHLEKQLTALNNQLRLFDPCNGDLESEQDRKAIAIIGSGKGVDPRAKNDDVTKYVSKKKQSYDEIIKKRRGHQSNGQSKQSQTVKI